MILMFRHVPSVSTARNIEDDIVAKVAEVLTVSMHIHSNEVIFSTVDGKSYILSFTSSHFAYSMFCKFNSLYHVESSVTLFGTVCEMENFGEGDFKLNEKLLKYLRSQAYSLSNT